MATSELPRDDLIRLIRAMQADIETLKQRSPLANTGFTSTGPGALALLRSTGVPALTFTDGPTTGGVQRITIADSDGRALLREDDTGSGAAWPLVPVPVPGTTWQTWDYTTAATFTTIAEGSTLKSSPGLTVTVVAIADGSAAGEVRVMAGAVQVGATAAFPTASLTRFTVGPQLLAGVVGDPVTVTLQARVASGAGKCYARVVAATASPAP